VLHPQGKNVTESEFAAIGNMLSSATWELPQAEEYKNDLAQPAFLGVPGMPQSSCQALVPQPPPRTDPNSPATEEQWAKVAKMVA
jgi:hypothetical protein